MRNLLLLVLLAACGSSPSSEVGLRSHVQPTPPDPNFTLFVSNQSFDIPIVDVEVYLDGDLLVSGNFDVDSQHTWIDFGFKLTANQDHELRVLANGGTVELFDVVRVDDAHDYGILSFWGDETDFLLQDDEPAFL